MSDEIEKLREELAEANARRDDLRTAMEWANEECDRLREQLAAKHSECPDCESYSERAGRFAAQADKLQRERDEARNALFRADQDALRVEEERDQLRAELRMAREGCDGWLEKCVQLTKERDNWKQSSDERNDECNRIQRTLNVCADERDQLRKERDEARAEVDTAARYCDELAETIRMHVAREIELEDEVERLREREREAMAVAHTQIELHLSAYRRGAEAMREQVMNWLVRAQAEATVIVVDTAIRGVLKLPEPEER